MRHLDRAVETLREGDRLLRGAVSDVVERCIAALRAEAARVDQEATNTVRFAIDKLPMSLVPYVEDPFAQSLSFNLHCERTNQSHTQAQNCVHFVDVDVNVPESLTQDLPLAFGAKALRAPRR